MKWLVLFFLMFVSNAAFACIDFTGSYFCDNDFVLQTNLDDQPQVDLNLNAVDLENSELKVEGEGSHSGVFLSDSSQWTQEFIITIMQSHEINKDQFILFKEPSDYALGARLRPSSESFYATTLTQNGLRTKKVDSQKQPYCLKNRLIIPPMDSATIYSLSGNNLTIEVIRPTLNEDQRSTKFNCSRIKEDEIRFEESSQNMF